MSRPALPDLTSWSAEVNPALPDGLPRERLVIMSVKSELLKLLEANRGEYLSGEQIASQLDVTRAAVWKAVKNLTAEGYHIEAGNKRGYRLLPGNDILSAEGIGLFLNNEHEIIVLPEVDSTNNEVKRRTMEGAPEGLVVLSEHQTAGKGRRGREFFSPRGLGIYMSMLFYPEGRKVQDVLSITAHAAVAVSRAIEKVCHKETQIKWVNDIILNDRKVCGILTEASADIETAGVDVVVVGVGINFHELKEEDVPEEIRGVVGYIMEEDEWGEVTRCELAAAVINELYSYYYDYPERSVMDEYRKRSLVLGKRVCFGTPGEVAGEIGEDWEEGLAVEIDDFGGLIVEMDDGSRRTLRTGEISLRLKKNM